MKNLIWIVIAAVIIVLGYMLFSGKSAQELADEAARAVDVPALIEGAEDAGRTAGESVSEAAKSTAELASDAAAALREVSQEPVSSVDDDVQPVQKPVPAEDDTAKIAAEETEVPVTEEATEVELQSAQEADDADQVQVDPVAPETTEGIEATSEAEAETVTQEDGSVTGDAAGTRLGDDAVSVPDEPETADADTDTATDTDPDAPASPESETTTPEAETASDVETEQDAPAATTDDAAEPTGEVRSDAAAETESEIATGAEADAEVLTMEGFDLERAMTLIEDSDLSELRKESLQSSLEAAQDNEPALKALLEQIRDALER